MKTVHNVYNELVSLDNIFSAWKAFKSGKTRKKEVMEFENKLEDNLFDLHNKLVKKIYKHSEYKKFIIADPKQRTIHKAEIKDRLVHTLTAKKLEQIYQPIFIAHSYSCQPNKGIHKALRDLLSFSRKASSNFTRNFWYLKGDIRKFFDNIDHQILLQVLKKKIKDEKFLWLIWQVVNSFHKDRKGQGLPLGNFTSQWLANVYLNELDYYVKHDLTIKYYLRYADDFLIISRSRDDLLKHLGKIKLFVEKKLQLALHGNKVFIKKFSSGIDFVGYRVLPRRVIIRKNIRKRIVKKTKERQIQLLDNEIGLWKYYETINSYLGWLKHGHNHKLSNKIIY